ncbi:MAG: DUF3592 domain-containing protein [Pseudomonadota bacterium]
MSAVAPLVVGVLMILAGPYLLHRAARAKRMAKKAERWPTVEGSIVSSEVIEFGPAPKSHSCRVTYEYDPGIGTITGDRVSFFDISTAEEANEFAARFTQGSTHPVYYHPSDPHRSVLVPGIYGKNETHGSAMAVILMLGGIAVLGGAVF